MTKWTTAAHKQLPACTNRTRWQRVEVRSSLAPTTDPSNMASRCHVTDSDVATKWWTTTDIHHLSSLCILGCHGEYPHPMFVPNHLAETQDNDGMTTCADEGTGRQWCDGKGTTQQHNKGAGQRPDDVQVSIITPLELELMRWMTKQSTTACHAQSR